MKTKFAGVLKIFLFISGFFICFNLLQQIFIPKWDYTNSGILDPMQGILTGFYAEEKNTLDVISLGASTSRFGISPMEMYRNQGIKGYNLSTNQQPFAVSFFVLKEALKSQSPKVVTLEISSLFYDKVSDGLWRYMLDTMPISKNKIDFAKAYASQSEDNHSLGDALVPLIKYHERWKKLSKADFSALVRNNNFFPKGYYMLTAQVGGGATEAERNERADFYNTAFAEVELSEYNNGIYNIERTKTSKYINNQISADSLMWLLKIKELCLERNIKLVMVKIPVSALPSVTWGSWTEEKHSIASHICNRYNIDFFDMQYDVNAEIDWSTDTCDGGVHLNLLGTEKVTNCLGKYLADRFQLPSGGSDNWDKDLNIYMLLRSVALLELENSFGSYIASISKLGNGISVFIAAADDMYAGLSEEDKFLLHKLGLKTIFDDVFRYSYVAVIEDGKVKYEGLSNETIIYENEIRNCQVSYSVSSSGCYFGSKAEIKIGNKDYSVGKRGMNIVVYDNRKRLVLDSVCFDTCSTEHIAKRNKALISKSLREFENYLIDHEAR